MNLTKICLGGLVATLFSLGQANAQMPSDGSVATGGAGYSPPTIPAPGGSTNAHEVASAGTAPPAPDLSLSSWMLYQRPGGCCGPVGGDGPIGGQLYARTGVSLPIGGGFLNNVLAPGWDIEMGARTLFFNPAQDSAWVFDIGVSNIYNNASDKSSKVDLLNVSSTVNSTTTTIPSVPVSVGNLNRTYLNLAGGKEWYLWGNADPHDKHSNMKAGVDLGGRWGTEKIDLNEIEHRTDTIGGVFFAAHADYETPCGAFLFTAGVRVEYSYTWSDILQHQNRTDIEELNVLLTAGVRF